MICCDICCVTRAIRGTDESVFAEGAGVGGRNRVGFWGDNNWEENTGHYALEATPTKKKVQEDPKVVPIMS